MIRVPVPILAYHQIDSVPRRGVPFRLLVTSPARFARQMRMLQALGYRGLSLTHLEPYLRGDRNGKVFGITFDDGYLNNFEQGLPVLQRFGFSATCFIVSGALGGSNAWDRERGVPSKPLLGLEQLRAWIAAGQDVGAHTRNHVNLLECDQRTAREEIQGSKQDLEDALGVGVRHFCYPYGLYLPEHVAMAREAGFTTATTTDAGRVHPGDDLMVLPRNVVLLSTSLPQLWLNVATGFEDRRRTGPRPKAPDAARQPERAPPRDADVTSEPI